MLQIVLLFAFIIPAILFLLAQQRILKTIRPENREISPGAIWLQLIPVFGMVWQFIVVIRIAHSVSKELALKTGESILDNSQFQIKATDDSPTYTIGLTYCTLTTFGLVLNYLTKYSSTFLASVGSLCFLAGMTCWIIYWVRLVKTTNKLVALSARIAE